MCCCFVVVVVVFIYFFKNDEIYSGTEMIVVKNKIYYFSTKT